MIEERLFVGDKEVSTLTKEELIGEVKALHYANKQLAMQYNQMQGIMRQMSLQNKKSKDEGGSADGGDEDGNPKGKDVSKKDTGSEQKPGAGKNSLVLVPDKDKSS